MLRHQIVAALAGALLALPLHASPEDRLVEKYDSFAGSEKNARELVEGLRSNTKVELSKDGKTTSFTPATGKLGYGNIDIALSLGKALLAAQGIHNPSPEQIQAALNGGMITTKSGQQVKLDGVLTLRAGGMGWGQIAHQYGFKLGEVMRPEKHHAKHEGKPELHRAKHDRPEKFERPNKPERPERPEKPHRGR